MLRSSIYCKENNCKYKQWRMINPNTPGWLETAHHEADCSDLTILHFWGPCHLISDYRHLFLIVSPFSMHPLLFVSYLFFAKHWLFFIYCQVVYLPCVFCFVLLNSVFALFDFTFRLSWLYLFAVPFDLTILDFGFGLYFGLLFVRMETWFLNLISICVNRILNWFYLNTMDVNG